MFCRCVCLCVIRPQKWPLFRGGVKAGEPGKEIPLGSSLQKMIPDDSSARHCRGGGGGGVVCGDGGDGGGGGLGAGGGDE